MEKGLTGAKLKWIAIVTMLIDHIGAVVIAQKLANMGISLDATVNHWLIWIYWVCRLIGRLSFPLFLFLLIEGFTHTKNVYRYGLNLFLFALISEIPFDLAVSNTMFYWNNQNIFFTLFLGLILLVFIKNQNKLISIVLILVFGLINEYLIFGDYGLYGIILLGGMYLLKKDVPARNIFVIIVGTYYQLTQGLSFLFMNQYNGQRGKQNKAFFYLFYPIHLLILQIIAR